MDFHLDNEIRLNNKTENESLYSWCLQEINSEGTQVGRDLIPWNWSFHFTASELRLIQGFEFGEESFLDDDEKVSEDENKEFQDTEVITATLHPGICTDGKWLEDDPRFSMLGTDRTITEFSLRISAVDEGGKEYCNVWGCVSYTSEIDFSDETTPDTVQIYLGLSKERFDRLADLISSKTIDVVRIGVSRVAGFYCDWSPSITTNSVKVLARGSEQEIDVPDGCEIEPPRLGDVEKFDLTLITRGKFNLKQNFNTLNISKIFEDEYEVYEEEEEIVEPEDVNKLLLTQIARNQAELLKLKKPVWFAAIFLGLLLLTMWL